MCIRDSRSTVVPDAINAAARTSAVKTGLRDGGNGLTGFTDSRYYAFPIPQNGLEVVWNHITRYRGGNLRRTIVQASPQTNGAYTLVNFEDEVAFPDNIPDIDPGKAENALLFFKQRVTACLLYTSARSRRCRRTSCIRWATSRSTTR